MRTGQSIITILLILIILTLAACKSGTNIYSADKPIEYQSPSTEVPIGVKADFEELISRIKDSMVAHDVIQDHEDYHAEGLNMVNIRIQQHQNGLVSIEEVVKEIYEYYSYSKSGLSYSPDEKRSMASMFVSGAIINNIRRDKTSRDAIIKRIRNGDFNAYNPEDEYMGRNRGSDLLLLTEDEKNKLIDLARQEQYWEDTEEGRRHKIGE